MALSYKAMAANVPSIVLAALGQDAITGLAGAGTTQGTATALSYSTNSFTTVAAGSGAVLSSDAIGGDSQLVYNGGANALKVYPPSGAQINGLGANNPVSLAPSTACRFECLSPTLWTGVLSA